MLCEFSNANSIFGGLLHATVWYNDRSYHPLFNMAPFAVQPIVFLVLRGGEQDDQMKKGYEIIMKEYEDIKNMCERKHGLNVGLVLFFVLQALVMFLLTDVHKIQVAEM